MEFQTTLQKPYILLAIFVLILTACSSVLTQTLSRPTSAALQLPTSTSAPEATATPPGYPVFTPTIPAAASPTGVPTGYHFPTPGDTVPTAEPPVENTVPLPTAEATATIIAAAPPSKTAPFDGQRAYQDLLYQMSLGPRTPGSPAHTQVIAWMDGELAKNGWTVEDQVTSLNGQPIHNVIAKRGSGAPGTPGVPWVIIGAHFDSRFKADRDLDPAKRSQPVPGADDGASGVAVLTELSRVLPADRKGQVWLAFIDSEDQGDLNLPGWDWTLGSRALADSLATKPDAVIILDMIGDTNLNILQEQNSDPEINNQIWAAAAGLGYSAYFIPRPGYNMLDDHTPFLEKGMRAVDLIDFDYPFWHTTQDTADKTSPQSLKIVGDTMFAWLTR